MLFILYTALVRIFRDAFRFFFEQSIGCLPGSKYLVVVVVVVAFTLKTVLTSIQYPSLSYSSRQRNKFP